MLASEITLDYGTAILAGSATVNTSCDENNGTITAAASKSISGNVLTLIVTTAGTDEGMVCAAGDSISVTAARVDANALGAGTDVLVAVGASVPAASQATNAITLISVGTLTVGNVQAAPSTDTTFKTVTYLLCDITEGSGGQLTVTVTVEEKFAAAFLSAKDESLLNGAGTVTTEQDFKIRFSFTNLPIGIAIKAGPTLAGFLAATTTTAALGTLTDNLTSDFVSASGAQDVDVDVIIDDADAGTVTSSKETLTATFIFEVPDDTKLQTTEGTGVLKVALRGSTTTGEVPVFAANDQKTGDVVLLQVCDCFLLYTWLPNTGDGAFDSGLTVSNTTADPPQIGTSGQTGDVTMYFWRTDGTQPAGNPYTIATALGPGETATAVISTMLGETFLGYGIVRAEFQLCHGFAFINNPQPGTGGAFAQGYLPQIIGNPRLTAIDPTIAESTGH